MAAAPTNLDVERTFPKVIPDISAWSLFPNLYAVGNQSLDRYVVIPEYKLKLVMEIISRLDGGCSLAKLAAHYLDHGRIVDLDNLHARLDEAGLLVGSKPKGELQGLGIRLVDLSVKQLFVTSRCFFFRLFPPLAGLTGITIVCGIWLFATTPKHWIALGISGIVIPRVLLYSVAITGYVGTIFWHELCHAIAAMRYGLVPDRISVVGYLALIPLFVIRIPGIYLLPPAQRICIWASGIWGSFAVAGIAMLMVHFVPLPSAWQQWLARVALANLFVAASNLLPFLPTDGYFILSTAFHQANVRHRAFKEFKGWIRRGRSAHVFLLSYVLVSGLAILALLARNAFRMYQLAHDSTAGLVLVSAVIIFLLVRGLIKGRPS